MCEFKDYLESARIKVIEVRSKLDTMLKANCGIMEFQNYFKQAGDFEKRIITQWFKDNGFNYFSVKKQG